MISVIYVFINLKNIFPAFIFANLKCLGIFAPLKTRVVKIKKNITKKRLTQLALFVAIIGVAMLFDVYFENNPVNFENIPGEANTTTAESASVCLISQASSIAAKTAEQKAFGRKIQLKSHDKFIQKYHQLRNYQVLKAEVQTQTTPLINSYRYLAFKNYFFSIPDDEPLSS